jgi:hypothetical protein
MTLELYFMIEPSHEPRGQGNGWELCDEHKATCFFIRRNCGELYEGLETRQQAEEWIEDHPYYLVKQSNT